MQPVKKEDDRPTILLCALKKEEKLGRLCSSGKREIFILREIEKSGQKKGSVEGCQG